MVLSVRETEQLTEALLSASPTPADLDYLVFAALNVRLNVEVNVRAGMRQQVLDLIAWAEKERRLHELVAGAVSHRPDNRLLRECAALMARKEGAESAPVLRAARRARAGGYRVIPGQDGYALYCNRTPQWELVQAPAFEASSELVFVPGGFEQGHDYFVERIKRRLAIDPKSIAEVEWPATYGSPATRGELLEMLGAALTRPDPPPSGSADEVAAEIGQMLASKLSQRNLLLVHATTLSIDFGESLLSYYTEWLPDILRQVSDSGSSLKCLKCYQVVEWLSMPWFVRLRTALARPFVSRDRESGCGESDARKLMSAIVARQAADVLRVRSLPELEDITDQDLLDLCDKWAVTDSDDRQRLVGRCAAARTSSGKLRIVDAVLPSLIQRDAKAA